MRELTDHIVSGDQAVQLTIQVLDEPGAGGANHAYRILGTYKDGSKFFYDIDFQKGPIKEAGVNGITQEALLAIVIDRLNSFQAGPFACADNQTALQHIASGLEFLQRRTKARIARGVEGRNIK